MHGCFSGSGVLVDAEVDSMGGVVDGGVGVGIKTSPRRAAIEKAQTELRQEYDVREERRRELDFLEKGGNPLDFKFGSTASHSVQSTSLTDQQAEPFANSEAKGSFALTASPHGDSVESIGRPGPPTVCEPNSADNLLLFDGETELLEGDRNFRHPSRKSRNTQSEQSSRLKIKHNAKESEDVVRYLRRYRSKPNRDAARSSSTDVAHGRGGHGTPLPGRGGSRDARGSVSDTTNTKELHKPNSSVANSASSNGYIIPKSLTPNSQLKAELDDLVAAGNFKELTKDSSLKDDTDASASKVLVDGELCKSLVADRLNICNVACQEIDHAGRNNVAVSDNMEIASSEIATKADDEANAVPEDSKGDEKNLLSNLQTSLPAIRTKEADSGSSFPSISPGIDGITNEGPDNMDGFETNETQMEKTSNMEGLQILNGGGVGHEKNEDKVSDSNLSNSDGKTDVHQKQNKSVKDEDRVVGSTTNLHPDCSTSAADGKNNDMLEKDSTTGTGNNCVTKPQSTSDVGIHELKQNMPPTKEIAATSEPQPSSVDGSKSGDKAYEDSILEEARSIQAKRHKIAQLSVSTLRPEVRLKSHWDFVIEEMAWLANDFAQERLWKLTAAAQLSHRVAFTSRLRFEEQNRHQKLKEVAFTLAEAIMQFWHSVENLIESESEDRNIDAKERGRSLVDGDGVSNCKRETSEGLKAEKPGKRSVFGVQEYARRFLKYNNSLVPPLQAVAPVTPDRIVDSGIPEISWDDHITEESLFYSVPSGAMEAYRKSVESHLVQCERSGSTMQEEVETSLYDTTTEFAYDEDEGETNNYYLPGAFEGSQSLKQNYKKRKSFMKSHSARSYELGADVPYYAVGSQQSMLMGKRSASNLNVGSVPTKRMRTASRQRVVGPLGAGAGGSLLVPAKTDASSGDTSSLQDDQSSLHGGAMVQKSIEVESSGNFEKQLHYDFAETSAKSKKKKKAQHLVSAYDHTWQLDSPIHSEQRDQWKKRSESHYIDSNGISGQHLAKKQKMMKHPLDNSLDNTNAITRSIPSPVASQMSNMSNSNKFIKLIGGRDKGRKGKALKIPMSPQGSGNAWSLFEDQALVVLVHDMGPNWELISDAINSTLKIKCIYRNPNECKERHKILMDRGASDGADSAEDSGTSQSYPSTLPGIPKGSARQLFQRLQGPMEEDTLKSHFEKIIVIGKKLHYRRNQNDKQHIVPVHNSQVLALSQVFPNNLNGNGNVLTPLDLCDTAVSNQDALCIEVPGSLPGVPAVNQGVVSPALPTSGASPATQGSSAGVVHGSNLPSPTGHLNSSVRDGRYNLPRTSLDEQQRIQQYNQILSSRNLQQQPGLAVPAPDRGLRTVACGNGAGVMGGLSRKSQVPRPGFVGIASPTVLSSGTMLSSGIGSMPNSGSMHTGVSPQGNPVLRPREQIPMIRGAQGNSQGLPAFSGLSSGFASQASSPAPLYPGHVTPQHQISSQQHHLPSNSHHLHLQGASHSSGTQHQAYAIRQRQMHQRYMQQQQFGVSGALMPHAPPQPQLPISSAQNTSQISSHPASMAPLTSSSTMTPMSIEHAQKPQLPPHSLNRNPQSAAMLTNQIGKQRQRQLQQLQQSGRQHPQQRQQTQSQIQSKLSKGMGRGNMLMHQSPPVDPSHMNGASAAPGTQVVEKGEQTGQLMQGQGSRTGASTNSGQPPKLLAAQSANHPHPEQRAFGGALSASQQVQQMPSHLDNITSQAQVSPISPSVSSAASAHQSVLLNHKQLSQQVQPQRKQGNQTHLTAQRMPPVSQTNHDMPNKLQFPGDPQPVSNSSQIGARSTVGMTPGRVDSAKPGPLVSAAIFPQQKQSESITTTTRNDRLSSVSQALGQGHNRQQPQPTTLSQKQCQLAEQQLAQDQQQLAQDQQQSSLEKSHQQVQNL